MPKSYFTILARFTFSDGKKSDWLRSWSKKIYTDKQQALESLINFRESYKGAEYKIVELRIVNEFDC